jgi:hypothetical protein
MNANTRSAYLLVVATVTMMVIVAVHVSGVSTKAHLSRLNTEATDTTTLSQGTATTTEVDASLFSSLRFEAGEHKTIGDQAWDAVKLDSSLNTLSIPNFDLPLPPPTTANPFPEVTTMHAVTYGDIVGAAGDFLALRPNDNVGDTGSISDISGSDSNAGVRRDARFKQGFGMLKSNKFYNEWQTLNTRFALERSYVNSHKSTDLGGSYPDFTSNSNNKPFRFECPCKFLQRPCKDRAKLVPPSVH